MKMKPAHPGLIFYEDVMKPLDLSVSAAAVCMGISRKTLSGFINGRYRLTLDLAGRIATATKTSPELWLNLQTQLDAWEISHRKFRDVSVFDHSAHACV